MILQIMGKSEGFDDCAYKECRVIEDVAEVNFKDIGTGEMGLHVTYHRAHRDLLQETFILDGVNAYLMNDSGKTIRTFTSNKV